MISPPVRGDLAAGSSFSETSPAHTRTGFSRSLFRAAALLLLLAGLFSVSASAQSAGSFYKRGQAAENREDWDAAYTAYQQAWKKSPNDLRYRTALYRVRPTASMAHLNQGRRYLQVGNDQGALTEFMRAVEIDPGDEAANQEIAKLRTRMGAAAPPPPPVSPEEASLKAELDSMGEPVQLKPVSSEPLTLHMAEDAKVVYQAIGRAAGVNVLFDPDYTAKRIQVDLVNSTLMDALRIVGVLSGTFWRPVTANTIFVAQNSRTKRQELEEQAIQTFYLANAWQQNDTNDLTTALRNVLTNIKVYGMPSQNAIVVRGTPDELLLAQKLINDIDKARPEVVVDIAVMEVSKNWERNLGLQWPSSASVSLQTPTTSSSSSSTTTTSTTSTTSSTGLTVYNLANLNSNDIAVTISAATANLLLTDSNTRILQNPRLRASDSQKATMKVGERIPIATGSYQTGAATALVSSLVNTQFQYIDVGVQIEMTPTVHFDRDVTLKLKIEVTAQSGSTTISGVTEPIIAQKNTEETVRLREGEANIVSGILNQQDQVSWSGIPGLSSIPILKYLFGSKDHTVTDDEVVFLIVPHVVRGADISPENLRPVDTGPGNNNIELRRIATDAGAPAIAPQVQPLTTSSYGPNLPASVAPVPGRSASAAASNAIAQLRADADTNTAPVPQTNLGVPPQSAAPTASQPMTAPPGAAAQPPVASQSAAQPAATMATGVPGQASMAPPAASMPANAVRPGSVPPGMPQPGPAPPGAGLPPGAKVNFLMNPPPPVSSGTTFQVPVVVSGAADVTATPLQVHYDPQKLALINVGPGEFLSRDGQAVSLVHRDDGPGTVTINTSRPPNATGVSGAGVICVLSFQAKSPGDTTLNISRPGAVNSKQQMLPVQGSQITVNVKPAENMQPQPGAPANAHEPKPPNP